MSSSIKRERFENVAGKRVQMVLDKIDNLSKCANKNNYQFDKSDIDKMIRAINDALKHMKVKFETEISTDKKEKKTFRF